jgi:hypothetical protein
MRKLNDIVLDIELCLHQGMSIADVARELEIPVHFVIEASEIICQEELEEDCSPYATINS